MHTLGINAAFHDPAACLVRDGVVLAAAEDERFTHVKHGKRPVPFSTWELPFHAIDYCLREAGITLADVDHVAYSFDPYLLLGHRRGNRVGREPYRWHFVPHHLAHAASAFHASPFTKAAVMTLDGRGEKATTGYALGQGNRLEWLGQVHMPHSLGILYERVTEYLGF